MNSIKFREGAALFHNGQSEEPIGFLFRCKRVDGSHAGSIYAELSQQSIKGIAIMAESLDLDDAQMLEKTGVIGQFELGGLRLGVSNRQIGTAAISMAQNRPEMCLPDMSKAYFDMAGELILIAYNAETGSHVSFRQEGGKVAERLLKLVEELKIRKAQGSIRAEPEKRPDTGLGCIPGPKHNDGLPDYGFVKMKTVQKLLDGISRTTLDRHIKEGFFPKPIHITPKCLGWPVEVIRAYFESKREEQRKAAES